MKIKMLGRGKLESNLSFSFYGNLSDDLEIPDNFFPIRTDCIFPIDNLLQKVDVNYEDRMDGVDFYDFIFKYRKEVWKFHLNIINTFMLDDKELLKIKQTITSDTKNKVFRAFWHRHTSSLFCLGVLSEKKYEFKSSNCHSVGNFLWADKYTIGSFYVRGFS